MMVKADPSILQCKIRLARIVWRKCVCRKAVGLMRVGGGHLIFGLDRVMRGLSGGEGPKRRRYLYI